MRFQSKGTAKAMKLKMIRKNQVGFLRPAVVQDFIKTSERS